MCLQIRKVKPTDEGQGGAPGASCLLPFPLAVLQERAQPWVIETQWRPLELEMSPSGYCKGVTRKLLPGHPARSEGCLDESSFSTITTGRFQLVLFNGLI